jgi:serine/threonine-protein kinase HipA
MAREAGIEMTECRLYEEGGRRHFLTRRFDRKADGGRIHMQTLGALAHFDFNAPGAHSYEEASQVMWAIGLGQSEAEQLFRRMVFNVYARNQDDHVKNISFLMGRSGRWSLAPAYDMTYAYNPGGVWTGMHQMTVNGKREGITREDLVRCGRHMNLRPPRIRDVCDAVCAAVRHWPAFAECAELPEGQARGLASTFCLT